MGTEKDEMRGMRVMKAMRDRLSGDGIREGEKEEKRE